MSIEEEPQFLLPATIVIDRSGRVSRCDRGARQLLRERAQVSSNIPVVSGRGTRPEAELPQWFLQTLIPWTEVRATLRPQRELRRFWPTSRGPLKVELDVLVLTDEEESFDGVAVIIRPPSSRAMLSASEFPAIGADTAVEAAPMLASIFRAAPVGIGVVKHRVLVWANQKTHEITGYSEAELRGQSARMLYPSQAEFDYVGRAKYEQIARHGTGTVETQWRRKDGQVIDVLLSSTPFDLEDHSKGVTFSVLDITHRRQLEERLRHSEKMEAIGRLAGGIAHDFNNQLVGIIGYAEILKALSEPSPELLEACEGIMAGAARAADLTRQLLTFSRKRQPTMHLFDLHEIVREVVSLMSRTVDRRIQLKLELEAHSSTIVGDPSEIQNAILNLALNARDAMPEGGTIQFRTSNVFLQAPPSDSPDYGPKPGKYLALEVLDDGEGIEPELLERIFEPFFTTKPDGQGTGMGLPAVWGTMQRHHGKVEVESQRGGGTRATIYLPTESTKNHAGTTRGASQAAVVEERHVLLVDDEATIRHVMTATLESMGCQVTACGSGQDAVDLVSSGEMAFDLVLLDMNMPELSGADTYRALHRLEPTLPVWLVSGYTPEGELETLLGEGAQGYLQKPFGREELIRRVFGPTSSLAPSGPR